MALQEVIVVVFAYALALLEPIVLHALHGGQLEFAAPVGGVGEPRREHVGERCPGPGCDEPGRGDDNKNKKRSGNPSIWLSLELATRVESLE